MGPAAPQRTTFQRARSAEQKRQRKDDILQAARELAVRDGVRVVTLTSIAERVGLAPSSVLENFGTREDIYFQLLTEAWIDWTDALERRVAGISAEAAEVARCIAETTAARPLFCDLLAYISPHYEYSLSAETVRGVSTIAVEMSRRFNALFVPLLSLTEQQSWDLNRVIHSFIIWWWSRGHPSADTLVGQNPAIDRDFEFASGLERWIVMIFDGLQPRQKPKRRSRA